MNIKNFDRANLPSAFISHERQFQKINDFLYPNNLLFIPTTHSIAPLIGSQYGQLSDYSRLRGLLNIACLGRLPQISMPITTINDSPIGFSLIAAHGQDHYLLDVMKYFSALFQVAEM